MHYKKILDMIKKILFILFGVITLSSCVVQKVPYDNVYYQPSVVLQPQPVIIYQPPVVVRQQPVIIYGGGYRYYCR